MGKKHLQWLALAALLLVTFAASGCGKKAPTEPGRYYDEERGISIKFPPGWEIIEEEETDAVTAICPFEDDDDMLQESVSVGVQDLPNGMELNEFSSEALAATAAECVDYEVEETGSTTVADLPATWTLFSYREPQGTITCLGYCLVKGRKGYLITCNAEPHTYPRYFPIFQEAASSLRIE